VDTAESFGLRADAALNDLEGHAPLDRLSPPGLPNRAEASFAEILEEFVAIDEPLAQEKSHERLTTTIDGVSL
jgi:hypothetical protein